MLELKELVRQVLEKRPQARNNDQDLLAVVWTKLGLKLTEDQYRIFINLPAAETITRLRREWQSRGLYQADDQIKQERMFKEAEYIKRYSPVTDKTIKRVRDELAKKGILDRTRGKTEISTLPPEF